MLRIAKCCRPVPGDPIVGYISLGRGITIHREDCPNAVQLRKDPDRFTPVHWAGGHETSFKVELQVDAWDRHRLLEDLSRTFAEAGSTSSRPAASSRTRWCRTGSSSRSATCRCSRPRSAACATSTRCSTPTASRRAAADAPDATPLTRFVRWPTATAVAFAVLTGCGASPAPHPSAAENAACPLEGPALRAAAFDAPAPAAAGWSERTGLVTARVCSFGTGGRRGNDRALVLRGPLLGRLLSDLRTAPRLSGPVSRCIADGPTGRLRLVQRSGQARDVQFSGMCGRLIVVIAGRHAVVVRGPFAELLDSALLYGAARRGERAAPDLTGLTLRAAIRRTRAAGYALTDIRQVDDRAGAAGRVAFQSPPPGNLIAPDFRDEPPLDLGVDLAGAPDAPPCTGAQLAGRYHAGGRATGSNFGSIRIRDRGPAPCRLAGPLRIAGRDRRGRRVTDSLAVPVTGPAVLVPRTTQTPTVGDITYGDFAADIGLSANARDDPATGGACNEHQLTPDDWRIKPARAARWSCATTVRRQTPSTAHQAC